MKKLIRIILTPFLFIALLGVYTVIPLMWLLILGVPLQAFVYWLGNKEVDNDWKFWRACIFMPFMVCKNWIVTGNADWK